MPNINLKDRRNRDALVRAESLGQTSTVRYVDKDGAQPALRSVLKATSEHTVDKLLAASGGDEAKFAADLVARDGDVDIERIGMFLTDTSRVFVNSNGGIVYHIEQTEIVRNPFGVEKERRPRRQLAANTEGEYPISWTGRLIKKDDAVRRFVFSSKLQIVHVNGLTFDFLYAMAKELADADSLMLLGAGSNGKDPLVFRRGSTPYRGFLEGRIQGDKYVLLLHLSKLEMKRPAEAPVVAAVVADQAVAAPPRPTAEPVGRKPTVDEVLAATAEQAPVAAPAPVATPSVQEVAGRHGGCGPGRQAKQSRMPLSRPKHRPRPATRQRLRSSPKRRRRNRVRGKPSPHLKCRSREHGPSIVACLEAAAAT